VTSGAKEVAVLIALLRPAHVAACWRKPADPAQARFLTPRVEDFLADTDALRAAIPRVASPARAWVAVAPHSVRAVPLDYLREVARYAYANGLPIHMHVAEQPAD